LFLQARQKTSKRKKNHGHQKGVVGKVKSKLCCLEEEEKKDILVSSLPLNGFDEVEKEESCHSAYND